MTSESTNNLASALIDFSHGNERLKKAEKQLAEFTKRFPLRNDPKLIQKLTPNDIYEKGSKDSFFYWVEFGTFDVAHLKIWGARNFENIKTKLQAFKDLLAKIVDDSLRLYMKVDDVGWDTFAGFGGDRHIAKKIIALFYPEKALPTFNTKHLEHFATKLGINFHHCMKEMFNKEYEDEDTTIGEKFEVLNDAIIQWKEKNVSAVDNLALCRFLYDTFPLSKPKTVPEQVGTLSFTGLLFEPENELGVVSLFSMYHKELGFPFIVKIQSPFPDATVIDDEGNTVTIEFEYLASGFIQHNHPQEGCDLIVCWVNDLPQDQSVKPEILILKDEIKNLMKDRFLQE